MEFNLVNLNITLKTDNLVNLQTWLLTLGNEFASACRSSVCRWPVRACDTCSGVETCVWYLIFGQKLAADPAALKRYQKPPLPFVFSFPISDPPAGKNSVMECGLIVIGRAIPHLEMLLEGLAELVSGNSCPVSAEIVQIGSRDYQGVVHPLFKGSDIRRTKNLAPENLVVLSADGLLENSTWDCTGLEIRLLSPLRLLEDGRQLVRFDFSRFARSVMRRVSSLAYYYGECEFDNDFKVMSAQSNAVICIDEHFNNTNNGSKKMSGITGYGRFSGDFSGLMPFLTLGMYFHVGKGAAYGMGQYEMIYK